jgi:hypothetical protein
MGLRFYRYDNSTDHALDVFHNIVIPETDRGLALCFQIFRPFPIILFLFKMCRLRYASITGRPIEEGITMTPMNSLLLGLPITKKEPG